MKTILRKIAIYTFTLYIIQFLIPGVKIASGLETIFVGGAALALMYLVIKPILSIISFPINLITLGLFSLIINGLILYILTLFIEGIQINAFMYESFKFAGFITPEINFNVLTSYIFTAFVISLIESFLSWLMN